MSRGFMCRFSCVFRRFAMVVLNLPSFGRPGVFSGSGLLFILLKGADVYRCGTAAYPDRESRFTLHQIGDPIELRPLGIVEFFEARLEDNRFQQKTASFRCQSGHLMSDGLVDDRAEVEHRLVRGAGYGELQCNDAIAVLEQSDGEVDR